MSKQKHQTTLTWPVLKVGDGRGFIVEHQNFLGHPERIVITAAHCLPHLPPPHPASYLMERTYGALLGPLRGKQTVSAECLFVDPISDIAVLGSPDNQELHEEAAAYEKLTDVTPLPVADAPKQGTRNKPLFGGGIIETPTPGKDSALVLSLANAWLECSVTRRGEALSVDQRKLIMSGMSGSPILSRTGHAIGVVSTNDFCPVILACLPARLKIR